MPDDLIRIERARTVLRDAVLDDLAPLAHWLQPGHRWQDFDGPSYSKGKGLGSEALGLWGVYLFAAMPQLARLDLRTWPGTLGMMRLAGEIGFVEEARFRKARIVNGEYFDGMGYGVRREEWREDPVDRQREELRALQHLFLPYSGGQFRHGLPSVTQSSGHEFPQN